MTQDLVPRLTTVQLVGNARRALAEARTLTDFRQVMEVATVATDAAQRAAKLMEAQGIAADVVRAANEAANDAAAVRIEAQAGAGRILREMAESGQRVGPTGGNRKDASSRLQLDDLGVEKTASHRWQKVGDIADNVRADYVADTKEGGGEITTAGLLRYAAQREAPAAVVEPTATDALEDAYEAIASAVAVFRKYRNAAAIAAFAANSRRKTGFRGLLLTVRSWLDEAEEVLK